MEIIKKLAEKNADVYSRRPATIVCFGDSVTQGCFEIFDTSEKSLETIYDQENAYHAHLKRLLAEIFPASPVNMINAGISGDNATNALSRVERDVLSYSPDLVIVCFGLNDCSSGEGGVKKYVSSMRKIAEKCLGAGAEVIIMTPNAMPDSVSVHTAYSNYPFVKKCVEASVELQRQGIPNLYIDGVRALAKEMNIPLCDVYAKWQKLREYGADISEMLANRVNHPTRRLNNLFAYSLLDTMLEN